MKHAPKWLHAVDAERLVAVAEAAKGFIVLLAGFGLLAFIHRDLQHVAEEIVRHLHMDAASHYPRIFIAAASRFDDTHVLTLAVGAMAYVLLRFIEAYGLWFRRRWAQWLAALSGGIYLPLEFYELARHVTAVKAGLVVVNLAVVAYMVFSLVRGRKGAGTSTAVVE